MMFMIALSRDNNFLLVVIIIYNTICLIVNLYYCSLYTTRIIYKKLHIKYRAIIYTVYGILYRTIIVYVYHTIILINSILYYNSIVLLYILQLVICF
jgi:hypothetical protein